MIFSPGTLMKRLEQLSLGLLLCMLVSTVFYPNLGFSQGFKGLKIGLVNLNQALNRSSAGERSKNILLASKTQRENELKSKDQELKKLRDQFDSQKGLMTAAARSAKEKELRERQQQLRKEVRSAQRDLQGRERKLTESIYIELKTVIEEIAKEEKFDLVLEVNAATVILYTANKFQNITSKVIQRYDQFQGGKK